MDRFYDYIILGSGVGGIYLAKKLAKKSQVLLVEKEKLGGTSLRLGAVPVKKLLDSFKLGQDPLRLREDLRDNWTRDLEELDQIIKRQLEDENIDLVYGDPYIKNSQLVEVQGVDYSCKTIIIATGTSPVFPAKLAQESILSHKDLVEQPIFNKDIVVYGANVEGVEIANVLLLLGNRVSLVEKEDQILHGKDRDLIQPIEDELIRLGAQIKTGLSLEATSQEDNKLISTLSSGESLSSDLGISTLFRQANLPRGLENTQVKVENGFIQVDKSFRTKEETIYALGDVNGLHGMAHVAMDQARILAKYLLEGSLDSYNYNQVPGAYFTRPEYVGVGLGQVDLVGKDYKLGLASFKDNFRAWSKSSRTGFVKVILDPENRILGIHLVGDNIAESLGYLSYFIGRQAEEVLAILVVHPSLGESIKEAIELALEGGLYEAATY